jgi:hypothetical protein
MATQPAIVRLSRTTAAWRRRATRRDAENLVAFDNDEGIRNGNVAFAVNQAPGTNGNPPLGWWGRLLGANEGTRRRKEKSNSKKFQAVGSNHMFLL